MKYLIVILFTCIFSSAFAQSEISRSTIYDGFYEATIFFEEYDDKQRAPEQQTVSFEVNDGMIKDDSPYMLGSIVDDGNVNLELQFSGGECYPSGTMTSSESFTVEGDCTFGDVKIVANLISSEIVPEFSCPPNGAYNHQTGKCEFEESGGGCLIATATYGSELAPQVQQLRELRDNSLLNTESGTSFINTFNDFYYSFSPVIADYERENPVFKEMVKVAITPMISSLSILNYVDMDSESEVLGYGISLILLNVGMYVGIPTSVIVGIKKEF
ncbi:CFI-box-CTERM domain-containing protein [Nitrosopumilus ureiphilus]|uniref:CFI-box-CTERM domain-containing protein n=1 Tax=Nitrosopumilus ureiphilus TaxID=1470067 RepID=UPI001FEA019D|nr:CFI-box-CTERM domain-containing protein [Nitrosopumilus ureiphilus]